MNFKLLRDVFDDYSDIKKDEELARNTINFLTEFVTKNNVHISFFGGALLGVDSATYTPHDTQLWLRDSLYIDDIKDCQRVIKELPGINPEFNVSSDIVNLSFIWVIYRLQNSSIKESLKKEAMRAAMIMSQIKHLTGGIRKRFEYGTDPLVAMSLYESLSRKSDLKSQGSWYAMLVKKADVFLEKSVSFRDVFEKMDNNERVVLLANEIYGSINKMLNNLTEKFYVIYEAQSQIKPGSKLSQVDGEQILKSYVSQPKKLLSDMEAISRDQHAFIKAELIDSTLGLVSTCSRVTLDKTLLYYTVNFYGTKDIRELQEEILFYMLSVTRRDKIDSSDIPAVVKFVRNMFRSSGTQNKDVLNIKTGLRKVVTKALDNPKDTILVSAQIALLLYIVLRALTIKAFS